MYELIRKAFRYVDIDIGPQDCWKVLWNDAKNNIRYQGRKL